MLKCFQLLKKFVSTKSIMIALNLVSSKREGIKMVKSLDHCKASKDTTNKAHVYLQ